MFLIFTCDRTIKTKLKHHIWNISLFSIFWSAVKCLLAYIPLVLMHLIWGTILSLKKYVNMAYFTCWDYESVTSLQKKNKQEMDGMCCLFAPFPITQVEFFLNNAVPIFKKRFYPVKHFLNNVNIAWVLHDWYDRVRVGLCSIF